jgi:hydrogenase-4 component B
MLAWEIMSLTSYFLVVFDRDNLQNTKSGYMYLIMTHVGATLILFALFLLYNYTGSFEFEVIKAQFADIPQYIQFTVIGLTLIGLGAKAGVIPMHIWLPAAHPAAPSHVSGLMSGVMIKTAIYMMIRLYLDILQPAPLWLGVTIVVVGAISALMGVLYALTEHDIKRLLAYSSIENIGIILLGLGSAIIFSSLGYENLMIVALTATLFHSFNHSIFKSLLFLSAGSIIQSTHTRNIEKYGGLIKFMPYTAVFFLVGSMAISALPPFNGFFSEWLTFQALFGGINIDNYYIVWVFVFGAGVLAITGGLAVACFVNAFGTTFLARPRSDNAKHAKESSPWMVIAMASLTISCFLIGLGSGQIIAKVKEVAQTASSESIIIASELNVNIITGPENGATISGPAIIMSGIVFMAVVWLAIRYGVNKNQKIRVESTWDCGTKLNGRMEITSSSFSQSIIRIFRNLLRPQVSDDIEYNNGNKYSVKSRTITSNVKDVYVTYLYSPIYNATLAMSIYIKSIQSGSVNLYVLYIFFFFFITLMLGA